MTNDVHGHTAKLLQFPKAKRAPGATPASRDAPSNLVSMQIASMAFDNCWYHDDAMREEARDKRSN